MTLPLQTSPSIGDSQTAPPHDATIPESTAAIIATILERFHDGHRCDLPGLIVLARKVESVHGNHPEAPKGLADFLDEVAESLEEHVKKEEQILFPMLRNGGHPMISHPIGMMRMEHDDHVINLGKLLALTNGGGLSADLKEHIRFENEILFPRFGD